MSLADGRSQRQMEYKPYATEVPGAEHWIAQPGRLDNIGNLIFIKISKGSGAPKL